MAYTTGTATNYRDLLDRLKEFLTTDPNLVAANQQWTVLRYTTSQTGQELILRAPGLAGNEEIYCGIRSFENASVGTYNWELQGFIGYNPNNTFANQPGAIGGQTPKLALWNNPIQYWLVANGRRVVVVAKVSTIYEAAYLGFILPYATPNQYPYPLLIGGSMTGANGLHYSVQWDDHRHFINPITGGNSTCRLRIPSGEWLQIYRENIWPLDFIYNNNLREAPDGTYVLFPATLVRYVSNDNHNLFGELDGTYHVSGFNNATENIIMVNNVAHLVIQNVYRTDINNYWALRLE